MLRGLRAVTDLVEAGTVVVGTDTMTTPLVALEMSWKSVIWWHSNSEDVLHLVRQPARLDERVARRLACSKSATFGSDST